MRKVVAVIQARMSSTRLPGKVLAEIGGKPAILFMIDRVMQASLVDDIVVATSTEPSDDRLALALVKAGVRVFRGDINDVLSRYVLAARATKGTIIVRLTGDCPLIDPVVIDRVVAALIDNNADYASNVDPPTWADGLDVEAFSGSALERAAREAVTEAEREHVTIWMRQPASALRRVAIHSIVDSSHLRLTIDHPADLATVRAIVESINDSAARFDHYDVLRCVEQNPDLLSNSEIQRNEKLTSI